ncbi:MAG: hypothetical protein KAS76_00835 [Thermoplasmatales archaeon]|nr:hypothetical protein [Thermoplasmatales archaeon]MCK4995547.1 hypothetical protein [Thermoplasmatales archaeon]
MRRRKKKIDAKLKTLGQTLGLSEIDAIKAKRTAKNVVALAIFAGVFAILGSVMMPGGPAGLYYTGVSIKDFRMLFGGWF